MLETDLRAAHALSQAVGWGHRFEDWLLLLEAGEGVVAVGPDGAMAGVAMFWWYGGDYGAVGMVIVSPAHQRLGIGRILMDAVLAQAGDRRLTLNATQEGLRLYETLGFSATGAISTHYGSFATHFSTFDSQIVVREMTAEDRRSVVELDR